MEAALDDDFLKEGARTIATAMHSPAGQIKLARVVANHLDWFERAQRRGLSWDQMIRLLTAAGAKRGNGLPFTRGHLSSSVWRARQEQGGDISSGLQAPTRSDALPRPPPAAPAAHPATDVTGPGRRRRTEVSPSAPPDKSDLRDYMRRSAEARKQTDES